MNGCPVQTGKPWTQEQILAAIKRGPHVSALVPAAVAQLDEEVQEKVKNGQARLVKWADIQHNPPPELKVSPIAMCKIVTERVYPVGEQHHDKNGS